VQLGSIESALVPTLFPSLIDIVRVIPPFKRVLLLMLGGFSWFLILTHLPISGTVVNLFSSLLFTAPTQLPVCL
jgi:hypothetical protein